VVTVDHSHNKFGNTTSSGNPTNFVRDGFEVHSIFKRKTQRHDGLGDNCPMIYALKSGRGLTTRREDVCSLSVNMKEILERLMMGRSYQFIVPMPSSSNITEILAERVRRLTPESCVLGRLLRKVCLSEALQTIDAMDVSSTPVGAVKHLRDSVARQLKTKTPADGYSVKGVRAQYRKHLHPVKVDLVLPTAPTSILLVEDLVASGTTIFAARDALQRHYPSCRVEALSLFSPMNGKLQKNPMQ